MTRAPMFSNKMAQPSILNTVGSPVLYLSLVRIPKLSAFFPITTSHLEFLLNSLLAPFILLTLPISSCLHCFTLTRPLPLTRPSPTFFHSPEQHQHQEHKRDHLNFRIDLPALKLLPWVVYCQLPKPWCISPFSCLWNYLGNFSWQIRFNVHLCTSRKLITLFAKSKGSQPEWPSVGRIANTMFEMFLLFTLGEDNVLKQSWLLHQPRVLGF